MFIGLFVALVSVQAGTVIRTPLVSRSVKYPQFFEVRENRVNYIDSTDVETQMQSVLTNLPTCDRPDISPDMDPYLYDYYLERIEEYNNCLTAKVEQIKRYRLDTNYYTVSFVNLDSLLYKPTGVQGESSEELIEPDSEFKSLLADMNPASDYLAFIVRPDSFEAFRKARQEARKAGFEVGWEPYPEENPIIFGSGGRSVGVQ